MSESKEFTINNRFEGEVLHKGLAKDFKSFCEEKKVNLSGSNLRGSDLSGSDLSGSNLRGSNLRGSDLSGSDLSGSDLSGSDLSIYCKWSVSFIPKTSVNPDSEKVLINEIDINTVLIKIGCKEPKTIADWDLWFEGTQVFDTPRSSFEFYQIKGMYLAYKAYLQTITSFKKEGEKVV